ncbi:MAG: hypothetical protein WBV26_00970 [Candidatus Sulfotelmatobacter sp.]
MIAPRSVPAIRASAVAAAGHRWSDPWPRAANGWPAAWRAQNRVRVSDGSRGQIALDQLLVHRLDIERADRRQISGAERWPDIPAKQAFGASLTFLPQTRFRCRLKPPIQVFVQSDIREVQPTAEVMLA